jgi:CHAD domain-containing protein
LAFQLKRGEPVPRAIRRIAAEQLDSSASQLRNAAPSERDEAVHEARKSIKKVRAILRLMAEELGPVAVAGNTLLRDLARRLSALRDAAVLVETVDSLKDQLPADFNPALLAGIRKHLASDRDRIVQGLIADHLPAAVAFALERASERVRTWPLQTSGFAALAPGLKRAFHRGRKDLKHVRRNPTMQGFHEWRKRVKDHWYLLRLLEGAWTEATRSYERGLKELETCLGDDHNLAVLRERIAASENAADLASLLTVINAREKLLRNRALRLGQRLYAPKPREYVRHAEASFNAWHAQRKSQGNAKKTKASEAA